MISLLLKIQINYGSYDSCCKWSDLSSSEWHTRIVQSPVTRPLHSHGMSEDVNSQVSGESLESTTTEKSDLTSWRSALKLIMANISLLGLIIMLFAFDYALWIS